MYGTVIHQIVADKGMHFALFNNSTDSYASPMFKDAEGLADYASSELNFSDCRREEWLEDAKSTKHIFTITSERIGRVIPIINKYERNQSVTADEAVMFYELYLFLKNTVLNHSEEFQPALIKFQEFTSEEHGDVINYLAGRQYAADRDGIDLEIGAKPVNIDHQRIAAILYKLVIFQSGLMDKEDSALEFAVKYRDYEFAGKI